MLTPRELELLTAHVDGELTPRQSRQVARLLRRNAEARELLERLMKDSRELSLISSVAAPVDFSATVLDTIAARQLRPRKLPRPESPAPVPAFPVWAGYAAAAAVLFLLGVGSFLINAPRPGPAPDYNGLARNKPDEAPLLPAPREERPTVVKKEPDVPAVTPGLFDLPQVRIVVPDEADEPDEPEQTPPTPPRGERPAPPVLASGHRETLKHLERVEFTLPRIHVLHGLELGQEPGKALREQLALGNAYRVEIPARDAARGFERLRATLAAFRATLTVPQDTLARLKKPVGRTDLAVYLENIAPEDLADALARAGTADREAAKKRLNELYFEGPLIVRELLGREDRRELKALLGLDPLEVRPSSARRLEVDIRKPLPGPLDDVLEGRGVPRPGVARGPSVGLAMALPLSRTRPPELKKFLEARPPARPGTLQVLLVLRNVGG